MAKRTTKRRQAQGVLNVQEFQRDDRRQRNLQVLEGGRGPVNDLYNTILRDPRHQQVMLLHYREISERRFTGWTMGHVKLDKMNPSLLLKYSEKAVLDPFSVSGEASMS